MPLYGESLGIRFSTTQQHGVVANDIPQDASGTEPDIAVIVPEIDAIFAGQTVNVSVRKFQLTQAEKDLLLTNCILRYSRFGVSGAYWKASDPFTKVNFYLDGLGAHVSPGLVGAFVLANCRMLDGTLPDQYFVGAFRRKE